MLLSSSKKYLLHSETCYTCQSVNTHAYVHAQTNIQINMTEPMNTYIWANHHILNQLHLKILSFIQYLLPTGCRKLFVINYCSDDMFWPQFLAIFMELASIFFYLKHVKLKWTTLTKVLITSSMWHSVSCWTLHWTDAVEWLACFLNNVTNHSVLTSMSWVVTQIWKYLWGTLKIHPWKQ